MIRRRFAVLAALVLAGCVAPVPASGPEEGPLAVRLAGLEGGMVGPEMAVFRRPGWVPSPAVRLVPDDVALRYVGAARPLDETTLSRLRGQFVEAVRRTLAEADRLAEVAGLATLRLRSFVTHLATPAGRDGLAVAEARLQLEIVDTAGEVVLALVDRAAGRRAVNVAATAGRWHELRAVFDLWGGLAGERAVALLAGEIAAPVPILPPAHPPVTGR
jgi:hypothetical protein